MNQSKINIKATNGESMENNELVKAINRLAAAFETFNKLYAHANDVSAELRKTRTPERLRY